MATDTLTPGIKTELAGLNARENTAQAGLTAQAAEDVTRAAKEQSESVPAEKAYESALAAPIPQHRKVAQPAPVDEAKTKVDPKEYEGLSLALIGMALIGGAVSHGNWMQASASLNGALKGFHEGNTAQAQREYDRFEREFKAATAQEKQADKEYEDALTSRKLTISEQLARVESIARRYGHEDVLSAAKTKSFQQVINQTEARRAQLIGTEQRQQAVTVRVEAGKEARAAAMDRYSPKTQEGKDLVETLMARGFQVTMGRGGMGERFDGIAAKGLAEGHSVDQIADDIITGKRKIAVDTKVASNVAIKEVNVERLTQTVSKLEQRTAELMKLVGNSNYPDINAAINAAAQRVGGDPEKQANLQELKTLMSSIGRQYVEAVTMAGSNAQMHATAQEWADGIFNQNMSPGAMLGAIRAMNREMKATASTLGEQKAGAMGGGGAGGIPFSKDAIAAELAKRKQQ